MNDFEKYKRLKALLDIEYKGIRLNRVLAVRIWGMAVNGSFSSSWKGFFLIFFSIDVRKLSFNPQKHKILSTYGRYSRRDHLELYQTVLKKLDGKASYNNTLEFGWRFCFHPAMIKQITQFVFSSLRNEEYGFWGKWRIATNFIHYGNIVEELDKMDFSNVTKYLSMCSVLDLEDLLTQYMKNKNVKTYSLQEGIYFIFKTIPLLGAVHYENFETDCLLCWGQYSVDEDIEYGIAKERLAVAGYPKNVTLIPMKPMNPFKRCMVLLGGGMRNTNIQLLKILSLHLSEYSFCLKPHPPSDADYAFYQQYALQNGFGIISKRLAINECLNNVEYDFAIAVCTTTYYEALMRGIPCLRFYDGTFDLMTGYDDVFATDSEFQNKIIEIQGKTIDRYQNEINSILKYAVGIGIDNYKDILLL